jgi:hypothetical protein
MRPRVVTSQVASSTPIDNALKSFASSDVQLALEELRRITVCDPQYSTAVLNGNLVLTSASSTMQIITGTATNYDITLPDARTLFKGTKFEIVSQNGSVMRVNNPDATQLFLLGQTSIGYLTLQDNSSANGIWVYSQTFIATATGILNYRVVSSTAFSTSSQSDVIITGFAVTPTAGTYVVFYNAAVSYTTTPKTHFWSIYAGGVQVTASQRQQDTSHSSQNMADSTMALIQFDGTQSCDVRVRCDTTGSLTVNARTLLMIRLGT